MFRAALLLAAAAALAAPAAAQVRDPALDRAKALRARDPDAAERVVRGVLARKPDDYYALYNLGLVEEARADRATGPARLEGYRRAAGWLERAKAVRTAQGVEEATIFNSLGVFYLYLGDLRRADENFVLALRHEAALTPASRGRLYSNIGYLQALQGRTRAATANLSKGAQLGDAVAQANLGRIEPVRKALAAGTKGGKN